MLNNGELENGINETVITLGPKTKNSSVLDDYRLISLCNVISKIISKVLTNRLKYALHEVISNYQSAFIPGRLISDNFLLAHEISRFIKSRKLQKTGYLSFKNDMTKAYDIME